MKSNCILSVGTATAARTPVGLVLEDLGNPGRIHTIELGKAPVCLGRAADNDLVLAGGQDGTISSHHATIAVEAGAVVIRDLGSTNGTFVNDSPVQPCVTLQQGDIVTFGAQGTRARVRWGSEVASMSTAGESQAVPAGAFPANAVGAELLGAVRGAVDCLAQLLHHEALIGPEATAAVRRSCDEARSRLDRSDIAVVIVGEQKAGKSTFLNAILGDRVLAAERRECTGTVTSIKLGRAVDYTAHFEDGTTERFADKTPDQCPAISASIARMLSELPGAPQPTDPPGPLPDAQEAENAAVGALQVAADQLEWRRESREASARRVPFFLRRRPAWWNLFAWILRLLLSSGWKSARAQLAADIEAVSQAEQAVADADVTHRRAQVQRLQAENLEHAEWRARQFIAEVRALTDMQQSGARVTHLLLEYPGRFLPPGLTLIDTPGVNTDNETNQRRAWEVIRREADGCILVSDLQQAVSQRTREFIQEVRQVVPHVLLVLTKFDKALANADGVGGESAHDQVEAARRGAVKRFAKEVGRPAAEVFAITVAAEPALAGDDLAQRRFQIEVGRIYELLQHERAVLLGARAASAVRTCVKRIGEAEAQAEASYRERIARLEAQRIPNPDSFRAQQLAQIGAQEAEWGRQIVAQSLAVLDTQLEAAKQDLFSYVQGAPTKDALKQAAAQLETYAGQRIEQAMAVVRSETARWADHAAQELEQPLLNELRERYRIAQRMSSEAAHLGLGASAGKLVQGAMVQAGIQGAVEAFESGQFKLGAGGAAAGAVIGTFIAPGIGTLIGGLIGSLLGFFKTLEDLKRDFIGKLNGAVETQRQQAGQQIRNSGPALQQAIHRTLDTALGHALHRFQAWIERVMEQERTAIERERQLLAHLLSIRDLLQQHDRRLERLAEAAVEASRGLCAMPSGD
jgi:GTP-binding protein EngB required for normal cell division